MAAEVLTLKKPASSAENGKPSASGAERRAWVRYPCQLDIVYWKSTGSATEACRSARVLDISAGGVCMLLNRPFEAGTVLTLQLENAEQKSTRTLLVHVVHVRPHSQTEWMVGCAFDSKVSEEDARALADWSRQASALLRQEQNAIADGLRTSLTPKQRRAVDALVTLPSLPAAAKAVRVRERTLRSWLQLPVFQAALRAARRQAVRAAAGRLQQLSGKAVDLLERHLDCGERAIEIEAALAILQYALQSIQPTRRQSSSTDPQPALVNRNPDSNGMTG
jgi:PilZ domain